jgi:hypothetical protein
MILQELTKGGFFNDICTAFVQARIRVVVRNVLPFEAEIAVQGEVETMNISITIRE